MRNITNWALLCTTNDPESLTIVRIAQKLGIPLIQSEQMHGATLAQEPELFARIRALGSVQHLAIVEIPGVVQEAELQSTGITIHILDHHTYPNLDRMQPVASLTQFLQLFEITQEDLVAHGFDPEIIHGIALIDQGFLWELAVSALPEEKQRLAREAYITCKKEIDPKTEEIFTDAKRAWKNREEHEGILIVRSASTHRVREAVAFCIADVYPVHPPTSIVIEGDGRISVQESEKAEKLFTMYGGFLFGKKRCWGILPEDRPPSVDKIIANIRQ